MSENNRNDRMTRRDELRHALLRDYERTIDDRVDRYLEFAPQKIVGDHYFAKTSSECIDLYRDGHYISTIMVTQAVNEGILKFVAVRNDIRFENTAELLEALASEEILSTECVKASSAIWGSYRNDIHHMNLKIAEIEAQFPELAKRNIQNLAIVECEVFGVNLDKDGNLIPTNPQYWDVRDDGSVPVYLRLGIM